MNKSGAPGMTTHLTNLLAEKSTVWEETTENKEAYMRQENFPSVTTHWTGVLKTLVKEVRNQHLMTFAGWTVRASRYFHTVPRTTNDKSGKIRLCWNDSGKHWS